MTGKTRLRTSVAAVALAIGASGAFAMAPVEEYGRGYPGNAQVLTSNDDSGNPVRARQFSDTRTLESSGRGSAIDQAGSSAFQEEQGSANAQQQPATGDTMSQSEAPDTSSSSFDRNASNASPSVSDQTARNQDLNAYEAGSGYTAADEAQTAASSAQDEKLLVVVPSNWNGSLPELISALDQATDESAIVVVDGVSWNPDAVTNSSRFE